MKIFTFHLYRIQAFVICFVLMIFLSSHLYAPFEAGGHVERREDRIEDLKLVRKIVSKIKKRPILMKDVVDLFNKEPELIEINKNVNGKESQMKSLKEDQEFLQNQSRSKPQ